MSTTERLAGACARHPWRTLTTWIFIIASAAVSAVTLLSGALTAQATSANNPESVRAQNLIEQRLTGPAKDVELFIVRSPVLRVSDPRFAGFVTGVQSTVMAPPDVDQVPEREVTAAGVR